MSKCKGDWIFILDADELVGEYFGRTLSYLDKKYQCLALPRCNLVSVKPLAYLPLRPHYYDWQIRFIRNNGKCFYDKNPVHHRLANYRPRLRVAEANVFHIDFLLRDYESRQKKVAFYESLEKGTGYPQMYLWEDYPYVTTKCIEKPAKNILDKLQTDRNFIKYELCNDNIVAMNQRLRWEMYKYVTRIRATFGI